MPSQQQRVLGALLGLHAGDALGATVEFSSWSTVRRDFPDGIRDIVGGGPFHWPPGHATDDTDLTRAVLLAYADHAGNKDSQDSLAIARAAGDRMLDWYDGRWPGRTPGARPVDVGGATRTGLERYRASRDPRRAGAGAGQSGNGSLMRCLPTGLLVPPADRARLLREAALVSAVTHDDWRCVLACCAYSAMAGALVAGAAPWMAAAAGLDVVRDERALETIVGALGDDRDVSIGQLLEHRQLVVQALEAGRRLDLRELAARGPTECPWGPEAVPRQASGYVLETLTVAVAALLDVRPLEQVLVDVVRVGRDTDTNGAVAGGLLGARDGAQAIPAAWRSKLQFQAEFAALVAKLVPA